MKKGGVINKEIAKVIASLGHTDVLIICDAGFPIPLNVERIDVAVGKNIPGFLDTIKIISEELYVEKIIVADELSKDSGIYRGLIEIFKNIETKSMPHIRLKETSKSAKAIIRTGEFTPYANVILVCGVAF